MRMMKAIKTRMKWPIAVLLLWALCSPHQAGAQQSFTDFILNAPTASSIGAAGHIPVIQNNRTEAIVQPLTTINGTNCILSSSCTLTGGGVLLPVVYTNADLLASCTASTNCPAGDKVFSSGVIRCGVTTANDAPCMQWNTATGPCASADVGSCNSSADGNSFVAVVVPSAGLDVRQFGVKFDNSTDNSTTLQAAWTWGGTGVGNLYVPCLALPGRYATAVTVNVANGTQLKVDGGGKRCAQLLYTGTSPAVTSGSPATGCALTINLATVTSTVSLNSFWLNTTNAGAANGLCISTTTPGGSAETPSDVSHVLIGGTSGLATYFLNAVIVTGNDGLNINDLTEFGDSGGTISTGLWEQGDTGTSFKYSINLQVVNSTFANNKYGYIYGAYVQGPNFVNSQFQNSTTGIYSAPGETGVLGGLFLSNVQFGTTGRCIDLETSVIQIASSGGVCLGGPLNDYAIYLPANGGGSITGMVIAPNGNTGVTGIFANAASSVPTTIEGNTLQTAKGISLGTSASNIHIGCTNGFNLSGGGTQNILGVGAANQAAGSVVNTVCGTNGYSGGTGPTAITAGQTMDVGNGVSASALAVALLTAHPGKVRNLNVVSSAAAGAGQSYTATMQLAGSPLTITCTISGASANTCSDIQHEADIIAAGQTLYLQIVSSAGAASANFSWVLSQDAQ